MARRSAIIRDATPRATIAVLVLLAWAYGGGLALMAAGTGAGLDATAEGAMSASALGAICVGGIVAAAGAAVESLFGTAAQSRAEQRLRLAVLSCARREGVRVAQHSGQLLSLATDAVDSAARYRAGFLGNVIGSFTTPLVVLIVYGVIVDAVVALWLALMIVVVPLIIVAAQPLVRRSGAQNRREKARLTSAFLASVQGLTALTSLRAAARRADVLAARGQRYRRSIMRILARNQLLILITDLSVSLGLVLVAVLLAAARLAEGTMTLGQAVSTVLVALLVIRPVDIMGQFFYIGIGGRAAERALDAQFEGGEPGNTAVADPVGPAERADGEILLDGVTAGWLPGRPVVSDLSLRVRTGERVALVGPSGAGKSTVSALVQGNLDASAGTVRVCGHDPQRQRPRLAVVEQRTFLFHGTIRDNLRIADASADESSMWHALAVAGLANEVRDLPQGLDTAVGEQGLTLSGGQAQRLAIARAVLRDAPILVLDEPTSQVDLAGESAFLRQLDALAQGRTVLMIAHRPGAILAADRTVELTGGSR